MPSPIETFFYMLFLVVLGVIIGYAHGWKAGIEEAERRQRMERGVQWERKP